MPPHPTTEVVQITHLFPAPLSNSARAHKAYLHFGELFPLAVRHTAPRSPRSHPTATTTNHHPHHLKVYHALQAWYTASSHPPQ